MTDFSIDPTLSVYKLVERHQQNAVINHRHTMSIVSHEIENASLIDHASTTIFCGFQRMSNFRPQMERYRQLAAIAQHIYVFGVCDCNLPPVSNITYVPLRTSDQLAKEWFLVSYGEDYFSTLAAEEITDAHAPDAQRLFRGAWIFDLSLVSILHDWLSGVVGLRYEQRVINTHNLDNQARLLANMIERLSERRALHHSVEEPVQRELITLIRQGISATPSSN